MKHLLVEEEAELIKLFESLDQSGSGVISIDELKRGLGELDLGLNVDINSVMNQCDLNRDGVISYSEFVLASRSWKDILTDGQLRKAFKELDIDGSGGLSVMELKTAMPMLEDCEVKQLVSQLDVERNGLVSFEEFKAFLESISNRIT